VKRRGVYNYMSVFGGTGDSGFGSTVHQRPNCNMVTRVVVTFPLWFERKQASSFDSGIDISTVRVNDHIGIVPPRGSNYDDLYLGELGKGSVEYIIQRDCEMQHPRCPESELELKVIGHEFDYETDNSNPNEEIALNGYIQLEGKLTMTVEDTCKKCAVPSNPYGPSILEGFDTQSDIRCACRAGKELGPFTPQDFWIGVPGEGVLCTRWTRKFAQKCTDITDDDEGHSPEFLQAVQEAMLKNPMFELYAQDQAGNRQDLGGDCWDKDTGECCDKTFKATNFNCCPEIVITWVECPEGSGDPWNRGGGNRVGDPGAGGGDQPFVVSDNSKGGTVDPNCPPLSLEEKKDIDINELIARYGTYNQRHSIGHSAYPNIMRYAGLDYFNQRDTHIREEEDGTWERYMDLCMVGDFEGEGAFPDTTISSERSMSRWVNVLSRGIEQVLFENVFQAGAAPGSPEQFLDLGSFITGDTWKEALEKIAKLQAIYCESHRGWEEMHDDLVLAMCRGLKCEKYVIENGKRVLSTPYELTYSSNTQSSTKSSVCPRPFLGRHPLDGTDEGSPRNCP
jgi:hypothetical protein